MSHMLFKQHTNIRSRKKIQKTFKKWFVFYIESTFDRVCFLKTTDCCISIDLRIALCNTVFMDIILMKTNKICV